MATLSTSGGNTTLKLEYTAATAKMANFVADALTYKYPAGYTFGDDEEPTLVADMTNAQKAELVEDTCKQYILDMAKAYHVTEAAKTAKDTATTEAETRYE